MNRKASRGLRALAFAAIAGVSVWAAWPGVQTAPAAGFVVPAAPARSGEASVPQLASFVVNAAEPARVHAASIAALPDGRLFSAWFGGSREGATDVKVHAAFFDPAAGRWGEQLTIATPEQTTRDLGRLVRKMGNPVAFMVPSGELWVVYVSVTVGGWATSHLNLIRSSDQGRTWAPATRLVASPFLNLSTLAKGAPVFFADGDIGLPVYHEMAGKFGELLVLTPDGRVRRKQRLDHGNRSLQPVVLVKDALAAVVLQRFAGESKPPRAWRSETRDGGRTWSAVEASDLANPNSALAALALEDGRLIAVANDTEDERLRLSLLVSDDDGRHWRAIHRFEDREEFLGRSFGPDVLRPLLTRDVESLGPGPATDSVLRNAEANLCRGETCSWQYDYPYLVRGADGDFHLVYTWNRSFIRHLRFNRAWLEERL
ncbi:sialidase family protein [Aromatoleum evansii]|uniref:Sialidase family protein n=1 Tax=Aromatoleum evansii TaxID=59406 RepID=A0ABZ1AMI4_AROEV|nr:sialidase family protein [Aromatoleum evansii]